MAGAIALQAGTSRRPSSRSISGFPTATPSTPRPSAATTSCRSRTTAPSSTRPPESASSTEIRWRRRSVVNEPSLPEGDYSAAKKLFLCKPHSSLDRYGVDASAWEKGKTFKADGFIDTQVEQDAFYSALKDAGCPMPVSRAEFGKVWRSIDKSLEIDTAALSFKADQRDFGAFIGLLDGNVSKMPRQFTASGKGDAWIFSGLYKQGKANSILMAVMDGVVDLTPGKPLDYVFLGGGDLEVRRGGKSLLKLLGPSETDIAIKSKDGADIAGAKELYVSFFRNKSCESPAKISLNLGRLASIDACDRLGNSIASVPFVVAKDGAASFENPWFDGARISYFRVRMGIRRGASTGVPLRGLRAKRIRARPPSLFHVKEPPRSVRRSPPPFDRSCLSALAVRGEPDHVASGKQASCGILTPRSKRYRSTPTAHSSLPQIIASALHFRSLGAIS
jgi:hypothetical protein